MINMTVPISDETQSRAQTVSSALGLDVKTVLNVLLYWGMYSLDNVRMSEELNAQEFISNNQQEQSRDEIIRKRISRMGCLKGKLIIHDDFKAPLEEFAEYM